MNSGEEEVIHHYIQQEDGGDLITSISETNSQEEFQQHATAQYYEAEAFLGGALTEEDRKLAAALVEVQYKNQNHPTVITSDHLSVDSTAYTIEHSEELGTVTYIQQDSVSTDESSIDPNTVYHTDSLPGIETITKNRTNSGSGDQVFVIRKTVDQDKNQIFIESGSSPSTRIVFSQKSSSPKINNKKPNQIENDNGGIKSEKKSLPHKKRIPDKLKSYGQTVKTFYSCNKCGNLFNSDYLLANHKLTAHGIKSKTFNCQLCTRSFLNQLKFFEHLKSHYEPQVEVKPQVKITTVYPDNPIDEEDDDDDDDEYYDGNEERINMDYNDVHTEISDDDHEDTKKNIKFEQTQYTTKKHTSIAVIGNGGGVTFNCNDCGKHFKRQKLLETHTCMILPKEEFSEPEDMMEGLRDVVDTIPDDDIDEKNIKPWESCHQFSSHNQLNSHSQSSTSLIHDSFEGYETINVELSNANNDSKTIVTLVPIHDAGNQILQVNPGDDWKGQVMLMEEEDNDNPRKRGRKPKETVIMQCHYCNREFTKRGSLAYHLRSHTGERPHQCDTCGKRFFASGALKAHSRLHLGLKPHQCNHCGRCFRQLGDLKYHMISLHSNIRQYQCEFCGKEFARKYSLTLHKRIHTGERNYQCEFCHKTFRANNYLQTHRRIHTGEKPHNCPCCKKPFRVRSDMKRHLNTHNVDAREVLAAMDKEKEILKEQEVKAVNIVQQFAALEEQPAKRGRKKQIQVVQEQEPDQDKEAVESILPDTPSKSSRRQIKNSRVVVEDQSGEMYVLLTDDQQLKFVQKN